MSHFLVTGANGFIGRHLGHYLQQQGHTVTALLRRHIEHSWENAIDCDLGTEPLSSKALIGIDGIFHCANIAHTTVNKEQAQTDIIATEKLLQAAEAAEVKRLVYFSSVKAVADCADRCIDESWSRPATHTYGRAKWQMEQCILNGQLEAVVVRPTLVYGVGVKGNLQRMIQAIDSGRFPPLPEFGNRRSMVGVNDVVKAALLAMEQTAANGQVYIVSDGIDYSTRALYEAICTAMGRPVPRWAVPYKLLQAAAWLGDRVEKITGKPMPMNTQKLSSLADSACYCADKISKELGWQPEETFYTALPEIIEAYAQQ